MAPRLPKETSAKIANLIKNKPDIDLKELALRFNTTLASCYRIRKGIKQRQELGLDPRKKPGNKSIFTPEIENFVVTIFEADSSLYQVDIAGLIELEFGKIVHQPQISRLLRRLNLTRPKPIETASTAKPDEVLKGKGENINIHTRVASLIDPYRNNILHHAIQNIKLTASLSSLGKVAWVRLDNDAVRFTVIPEVGTQVWASLSIDSIFEDYTIQSAAPSNTINLELPLLPLNRALKSALNASSASIRLTKRDGVPVLSLTIITNTISSGTSAHGFLSAPGQNADPFGDAFAEESLDAGMSRDRETIVTQDIPIRVLTADSVEGIHEPRVREPDAHIVLPPLLQLKAISDRFTKLATSTSTSSNSRSSSTSTPKLELAANMHGSLKLRIATDALNIESVWTGLLNPELDPQQVEDGEEGLDDHPSSRLRARGPDAWSTVRIDGRDWGRVLSVGRLGGRVIACFADEHALILYVYLSSHDSDDSVLTYYISSFSV